MFEIVKYTGDVDAGVMSRRYVDSEKEEILCVIYMYIYIYI